MVQRYENSGVLSELQEGINALLHANRLIPDNHHMKSACLNDLGTSFQVLFDRSGDIADLHQAIMAQQQALTLTPDGHPHKPGYFNNLGISFESRFGRLGDIADLDEAITAKQQAVTLTPDGHPDKPGYFNNLGISFHRRFWRLGNIADLDGAIRLFSQSAKSLYGHPSVRFASARKWATLCFSVPSVETLDAYSTLVNLIPRVVWVGRTVEQRYTDTLGIGYAVADAAAAAIHFGELGLALEWLEQGRSIVWGQILQLRTPLDELHQHHPTEADELELVSRALDSAGVTSGLDRSSPSSDSASQSLEMVAQAHRRRAKEYDDILARIRNFPSFSEFLQPKKSRSLCGAAVFGPVVIVNASTIRCDALILLPRSSQVFHVPLPTLQIWAAHGMQLQLAGSTRGANMIERHYAPHQDMELSDILDRLWLYIVEPILRHLKVGYFHPLIFSAQY